jgi:hypothetical protein
MMKRGLITLECFSSARVSLLIDTFFIIIETGQKVGVSNMSFDTAID